MKRFLFTTLAILLLYSCANNKDYTKYVNVFAGAADLGHCMPCACRPMSMIKVGPESGNWSWDYTGGYQYKDSTLNGFSQNRINGTGCPDLGDLLMFPFCGEWTATEYKSRFKKAHEKGEPGYYSVYLDDSRVFAEMTATPHVSIQKYRFDDPSQANLMIDFQSGIVGDENTMHHKIKACEQNFIDPYHINGNARTVMWVDRWYYYEIEFDAPYTIKEQLPFRRDDELAHRYVLSFDIPKGNTLTVKASISRNSIDAAHNNIALELPGWDLDSLRAVSHDEWNAILSRIKIKGTREQKNLFYSSMYRLFVHPDNVGDAGQPIRYSTLSLWDTYRAAHPLYTLVAPERVDDFINSMIAQEEDYGQLPIWSLWGQENWCMIGNHSVPVIVDAYLKGFRGFDVEKAYNAIKTSLTTPLPKSDWTQYDKYGYFPFDMTVNESVSRTLECCYDDWCAAQLAKALGEEDDYNFFINRSSFYKNLFDPSTGLMRAKDSEGNWREPFDVFTPSHDSTCGGDYTEGNAWQYTWHVQHDVQGLIDLYGGAEPFITKLDSLFVLEHEMTNEGFVKDVSGLIGQYAHGNEPSHHVAYLYTLAGKPHKTEEMVNTICKTQYKDGVDGLCGNDDCGQMSAWYIFSVLGFYPVNPCGGEFVLGAPQLPEASLQLPGGKSFTIIAKNYSPENIYVDHIEFNGVPLESKTITYEDIMRGGTLIFHMTK